MRTQGLLASAERGACELRQVVEALGHLLELDYQLPGGSEGSEALFFLCEKQGHEVFVPAGSVALCEKRRATLAGLTECIDAECVVRRLERAAWGKVEAHQAELLDQLLGVIQGEAECLCGVLVESLDAPDTTGVADSDQRLDALIDDGGLGCGDSRHSCRLLRGRGRIV